MPSISHLSLGYFEPLIFPLLIVFSAFLLGFIFEKILFSHLKKLAKKTKSEMDDILLRPLRRRIPTFWFVLGGSYLAMQSFPFSEKTLSFLTKGLLALAILSVTYVLSNIITEYVTLKMKKIQNTSISITVNISKTIVYITGILVILQTMGISIAPVLTALGVGGLAVALALQDTLSNVFAGIQIIASKKFRVGDYVKLDSGEEGYVEDIAWRYTTIKSLPNNIVIIPNSKIASVICTNFSLKDKEMGVLVQVGVHYDSDLKKVEAVTMEVGKEVMGEVEGGVPSFEPFIRYHTFGDSSVNFTVILRGMDFASQYLIKHEFIKRLHERYRKEGIEIPFPIRTVVLKQEKG